jgi:hypothetical protein
MNKDNVLSAVEKEIRSIPGVLDLKFLDPTTKKDLSALEKQAEKNGACGGLMPFVNRGVWESLGREVSVIIVGNAHMIVDNEGLLYMMDQKGQILGEYVPPGKKADIIAAKPDCRFLSEDFILHPDVKISGEPYFVISEVAFHYLDDVKGITRITSGSVSTMADDWIRGTMGYKDKKTWTHLVGFDLQ